MTSQLHRFLQSKRYIFWYVKDLSQLSDEAIVEGVIKYGSWDDLKTIIFSKDLNFKDSYQKLISKKRQNLSPIEKNFISKLLENV